MYPKFNEIIQSSVNEYNRVFQNASIYEIEIEKKRSGDYIVEVEGISENLECEIEYSLNVNQIVKKEQKIMNDYKVQKYQLKEPLNLEEITITADEATKILLEQRPNANIIEWELEMKYRLPIWEMEFIDSDNSKYEIKIDATNGQVLEIERD